MGESLCCGHQWRECGATAPARWHLIERYAPFESDSTGQIRGSRRQRPQGKAFVGRMAGWLATSAIRRPVCNKRLRHAKSPRPPFDPDIPHARFVLANVEQMVIGGYRPSGGMAMQVVPTTPPNPSAATGREFCRLFLSFPSTSVRQTSRPSATTRAFSVHEIPSHGCSANTS